MSKENLIKKQSLYIYMPSQARPRDLSRDQHMTCHMTNMWSVTITGIISLNIPNPPLDREATSSPYEELNETFPRAARGSARPRIISFPLNNLINFFKKYTQGFKEKVTRPKEKGP